MIRWEMMKGLSLLRARLGWLRYWLKFFLGSLLNLAGLPGFTRECDYASRIGSALIRVRVEPIYTIVSVNGLDIYFHRLSGAIDGVGLSPASDCTLVSAQE